VNSFWGNGGSPLSKAGETIAEFEMPADKKQTIANWVEQLGWTKPPAGAEISTAQPSVP
jgi:hypothetical protein